jgi:chromosome segregation ATPase
MTNDEMRALFREELGGVVVLLKDEMREELGSFKSVVLEEVAHINQRIDQVDQRIDQVQKSVLEVKGNVAMLDQKVDILEQKVSLLDQKVDVLEQKVSVLDQRVVILDQRVTQCTEVLDEATVKIAELQQSFYNLGNRMDTFQKEAKKDNQALIQQIVEVNRRLDAHIATPWDKAHPSPGTAA